MPLIDANDPRIWDGGSISVYRNRVNGRFVGYTREVRRNYMGNDHWVLRQKLGLKPGQSILIVGAGYGWVAEDWQTIGLGPIICVDNSTWIQTNKCYEARVPIHSENILNLEDRERIRQLSPPKFDWAISEDVLSTLSDSECLDMSKAMNDLAHRVVHWISVGNKRYDDPEVWAGDPRLNWKTSHEWKNLLGNDHIIARNEVTF